MCQQIHLNIIKKENSYAIRAYLDGKDIGLIEGSDIRTIKIKLLEIIMSGYLTNAQIEMHGEDDCRFAGEFLKDAVGMVETLKIRHDL